MTGSFFVPEGETLFLPIGKYKFVGPMYVKLDPSFHWPDTYVSGNLVNYEFADATEQNTDLRDDTQVRDIEVLSDDGSRENSEESGHGKSSVREDPGESGQPKNSGRKQRRNKRVRGDGSEDSEIQTGSDEDSE